MRNSSYGWTKRFNLRKVFHLDQNNLNYYKSWIEDGWIRIKGTHEWIKTSSISLRFIFCKSCWKSLTLLICFSPNLGETYFFKFLNFNNEPKDTEYFKNSMWFLSNQES